MTIGNLPSMIPRVWELNILISSRRSSLYLKLLVLKNWLEQGQCFTSVISQRVYGIATSVN